MRRTIPLLLLAAAAAAPLGAQSMTDYARCQRVFTDASVRAAFEQQVQREPTTVMGHFAAGCLDAARRAFKDAAAHFEQVMRADPRSAAAFTMYGNVVGAFLPSAGLVDKARYAPRLRAALETAITLDGANVDARWGLMQYYLSAPGFAGGDKAKGRAQAEAIMALDAWRGTWARVDAGEAARDRGYVVRALTEATRSWPDSSRPWLALAEAHLAAGESAAAWRTVEGWMLQRPGLAAQQYGLGLVSAGAGERLEIGEASLRAYLAGSRRRGDPGVADAQYQLGRVLERLGRRGDARAAWQAALGADPAHKPAKDALARLE
ncbi:MAG: hypothetical protein MUF40_07750 [Gemmatimonadaceae bacterium]|jgi:tetratricopeptide (TPR) repeat protein|nr:hypothetical protein [Gemmatimonadaceae bacterium]